MNKKILYIVIMAVAVLAQSCYYDNEEYLYSGEPACDTEAVSFSNDIMPIIQGNCSITGCHVAGGSGNGIFEGYAGVKEKVDNGSLHQRVIVDKTMPPSAPLNECQIAQIDSWINAGAPNN